MLAFAEALRLALVPMLGAGVAILAALLAVVVVQRGLREWRFQRNLRIGRRYQAAIDEVLASGSASASALVAAAPRSHRPIIAPLLLKPMVALRGAQAERARELASTIGLADGWRRDLESRRWFNRAEAALALGLVGDRAALPALIEHINDPHEQVRAAVIDALGRIGEPSVVPVLLARLGDQSRHERTRLVQALRSFGQVATDALVAHGRAHPDDRALVGSVLTLIGGTSARDVLLSWTSEQDAAVRAAAWKAVAAIGLDDRAFYHALKALDDEAPAVRAMAAQAIGRSGREDGVGPLAHHLDDEWDVAAQAARALSRLGAQGAAALEARCAGAAGHGLELARQLVWERARR